MKENYYVLFMCGSVSDKEQKNLIKITGAMKTRKGIESAIEADLIEDTVAVASADRLNELIIPTINEHNPDAIIYFGAYSLVLGSAIANALDHLRRYQVIVDGRGKLRKFYQDGDLTQRPPMIKKPKAKSNYFHDETFIPFIAVPMPETISKGGYAFNAVTGHPSIMEPRPAVPKGNFEAAVNAVYHILKGGYEGVDLHIDVSSAKESAENIEKTLEKLGVGDVRHNAPEDSVPGRLDIFVFDQGADMREILYSFERESEFYIGVPLKQRTDFDMLLKYIEPCSNGIFLRPGAVEDAAILAAQIISLSLPEYEGEALEGSVRRYINEKTANSMWGIERGDKNANK